MTDLWCSDGYGNIVRCSQNFKREKGFKNLDFNNQSNIMTIEKIIGIIYIIINLVNKKVYIGQTQQKLSQRWSQHKSSAKTGEKTPLYNSMRYHGIENFRIKKIEEVPIKLLDDKEIEYIRSYKSNIQEYGNIY